MQLFYGKPLLNLRGTFYTKATSKKEAQLLLFTNIHNSFTRFTCAYNNRVIADTVVAIYVHDSDKNCEIPSQIHACATRRLRLRVYPHFRHKGKGDESINVKIPGVKGNTFILIKGYA